MPETQHVDRAALQLSRGLGWFSIALGAAEVLAPAAIARIAGVNENEQSHSIIRTLGAREIGNGLAILADPSSAPRVWSRVAGDAIDLGFLASALRADGAEGGRLGLATAMVAGVTVLDVMAAQRLNGAGAPARRGTSGVRIERVVTVNRPIEEVYGFWRNVENLPRFMRHLEEVTVLGNRRSRWRAKAPAGMTVEWEAELTQEKELDWIAWRSLPGSQIENSGSVRFERAPGARGTELRVQLQYRPPAGRLGRVFARLFGEEPSQQIADDLRRFKQLMETGEIPLSDGPGLWRAAQPAADPEAVLAYAGVNR
ncbi:MAG TPA: SRPBCC family protein [Vicinamibacterales bacterium]|jgi:uncharacterized membrane protein